MKAKTLLKLLLGVSILSVLIYKVGSLELLYSMFDLGYLGLIVLFLHVFFQILFSSFNIKVLTSAIGHKIPYTYLLSSYVYVWSLGKFLPGGFGELSVAYYLRKKRVSAYNSIFVAIFDKLVTLATLSVIALLGVWLIFDFSQAFLGLILVLLVFFPIIMFWNSRLLTKIRNTIQNPRLLLINIIVTLTKSMFAALTVFILLLLLGIKFNPLYILTINSIVGIIVFIPITIGGIGTKEASAVYLYSLFGIDSSIILSIYLMLRAVVFISTGVFALTFIKRKKTKGTKKVKNGVN